jgi:2-dehydropantoate 2-reductase
MRILVVGAGAIGGYFGGRLLKAGRNVTFLVRPRRAAELAKSALMIRSRMGDLDLAAPPTIAADKLRAPYDLILLSCKAYDLEDAMEAFAPAVGPQTAVLPLLNGLRHLDMLAKRFGAAAVLGGQCVISASVDPEGRVLHLADTHSLTFGELDGVRSPRVAAIEKALSGANFEARASEAILQEMWEKWVFIASGVGITCLMRAAIGDIVATGGGDLATAMYDECAAIAARHGFAPRPAAAQRSRGMFTTAGSPFTASMFRDIERRAPIEADHVVGDLLQRGGEQRASALLRVAYVHLKAYEARRAREAAATAKAA